MTKNECTTVIFPDGHTPALGHLKKSVPTFEIFIEDEGMVSIYIWKSFLKRIIPKNFKISIMSIKGRNNIVINCSRDQSVSDGRFKLFIIDSDMDLLTGKPIPKLRHLYRLNAYCIENYLLEEQNILNLCEFLNKNMNLTDMKTHFGYEKWKESNEKLFEELFVCYATVQIICDFNKDAMQNVKYSVYKLSGKKNEKHNLCKNKVKERIRELYNELIEKGYSEQDIKKIKCEIENRAKSLNFMRYVCGKTHLFNLIYEKINADKNFAGMQKDLIVKKLSEGISPTFDQFLIRRINRIAASKNE